MSCIERQEATLFSLMRRNVAEHETERPNRVTRVGCSDISMEKQQKQYMLGVYKLLCLKMTTNQVLVTWMAGTEKTFEVQNWDTQIIVLDKYSTSQHEPSRCLSLSLELWNWDDE